MEKMLAECEEKIMAVIWESDKSLSMKQIMAKVNQRFEKDWAPSTITTFLRKAVSKGYLSSHRSGRVFFYTPLISQKEYLKEKLTRLAKDFGISKEDIETVKTMTTMKEMLADCEEKVMAVIWKGGEELDLRLTIKKVNQRFRKDWAPTTVSTFLKRAVSKGYLSRHRSGRDFFYTPLISQEEYLGTKLTIIAKDFNISIEDIRELL